MRTSALTEISWKQEMKVVSNGLADDAYCNKLEREARASAEYIQNHGVRLNHEDEPNVLFEFKTDQHFVFADGGGPAIIGALFDHMRKYRDFEVHWETEATKLLTDDQGVVTGAKVRKNDGLLYNLMAHDVVLACGGFEGNNEMLACYVGRNTHSLPLIVPGIKHNKGAGLRMALDVGADTAGSFDGIHCELVDTRTSKPDAVIWGHNYGVVVNQDCERFYDEGQRQLFATLGTIARECWKTQNQKCYFVTDDTIMKRFRPGWVYDTTDKEPETADSIPELAEKLGLDPQKLDKTVSDFNRAINSQLFDLMRLDGKATSGLKPNKTNWANPIARSPFYGYPMT